MLLSEHLVHLFLFFPLLLQLLLFINLILLITSFFLFSPSTLLPSSPPIYDHHMHLSKPSSALPYSSSNPSNQLLLLFAKSFAS